MASSQRRPYTPLPNALIDVWMPRLRDTEWRVLCVVARQTLGWQDGSERGRKKKDWLSHSQITRRTGRASEATSRAINELCKRGLITITNEAARPLLSPSDRRRALRLYFQLGPALDMIKFETEDEGKVRPRKPKRSCKSFSRTKSLETIAARTPSTSKWSRAGEVKT
jgi:hypothetical protein